MVHGFTQTHRVFDRQVPVFREPFNLLLVDLRGHGGSSHFPGPFGIEEYTDDLEGLVDCYGLKTFYYWGTHTGTAIGLVYTLRHPGRVLGLILEGTVLPGFPMPRVPELIDRAGRIAVNQGMLAAKDDWFDRADWFDYIRKHPRECRAAEHREMIMDFSGEPWLQRQNPRAVTNVDLRLNELRLPILMYNGIEDMADFLNAAGHIRRVKGDAQYQTIPNAGGFPGWENPDVVNRIVTEFLKNLVR